MAKQHAAHHDISSSHYVAQNELSENVSFYVMAAGQMSTNWRPPPPSSSYGIKGGSHAIFLGPYAIIFCRNPLILRDFYAIRTPIVWRILGTFFCKYGGGGGQNCFQNGACMTSKMLYQADPEIQGQTRYCKESETMWQNIFAKLSCELLDATCLPALALLGHALESFRKSLVLWRDLLAFVNPFGPLDFRLFQQEARALSVPWSLRPQNRMAVQDRFPPPTPKSADFTSWTWVRKKSPC